MKLSTLQLFHWACFDQTPEMEFGPISLLIGKNNSGKSTIIRAIGAMQQSAKNGDYNRISRNPEFPARAIYKFSEVEEVRLRMHGFSNDQVIECGSGVQFAINGNYRSPVFNDAENEAFLVPYYSSRKVDGFHEDIRAQYANSIHRNMGYLAARLSKIANSSHPLNSVYSDHCKEVLGVVVTSVSSANGQLPGIYIGEGQELFIQQMGEGVANIVHLLIELVYAKGKLFLIEEIENDIHPEALKALLDLVLKSSRENQFIISTHSNIVLRHLASSEGSKVYHVRSLSDCAIPTSTVSLLKTEEERLGALRDMGYSLADFDLWEGWLFLEEASAEIIIRDYLIPWFAPKLSRLRTHSAAGIDGVEPSFIDFHRLMTYVHLNPIYKHKAWVRVDGDRKGQDVVARLNEKFQGWPDESFGVFAAPAFETYYPQVFFQDAKAALNISDKQERRIAKKQLLGRVRKWLDADKERGKAALEMSAREVIDFLVGVEAKLVGVQVNA